MLRQKSIFTSLTFWAICLSYLNAIVSLLKTGNYTGFGFDFYIDFIETSVIFAIGVIGRYNAKSVVFTPDTLIGRNKS